MDGVGGHVVLRRVPQYLEYIDLFRAQEKYGILPSSVLVGFCLSVLITVISNFGVSLVGEGRPLLPLVISAFLSGIGTALSRWFFMPFFPGQLFGGFLAGLLNRLLSGATDLLNGLFPSMPAALRDLFGLLGGSIHSMITLYFTYIVPGLEVTLFELTLEVLAELMEDATVVGAVGEALLEVVIEAIGTQVASAIQQFSYETVKKLTLRAILPPMARWILDGLAVHYNGYYTGAHGSNGIGVGSGIGRGGLGGWIAAPS